MSHIFISHSHEDSDFAEILQNRLEDAGYAVWKDTGIRAGKDWRKEIDHAIREASVLVVTITSQAKASEYVTYEWAFAWGAGVEIIPILLEKTELHPRLESLQYLDFSNRNARPWNELIELLQEQRQKRLDGIPPIGQIHGYSGEWEITTTFLTWQNQPVIGNDRVVFKGKMFLLLSADGQKGSGTQTGELIVRIDDWEATYMVATQVTKAYITPSGGLHITIEVLSRNRDKGTPPPDHLADKYSDKLFGKGPFDVTLDPSPTSFMTLTGGHDYTIGYLQEAKETYKYIGFSGTTL